MKTSTLTSLAILKVNADIFRKDYIENFVPFVAQCLKEQSSEVVSTLEIQKLLISKYGLNLPQSVINTILNRTRKLKYTRKERGVLYRNTDELENLNFKAVQSGVTEQYNGLIEFLMLFCNQRFQKELTTEEAELALLAYIDDNQIAIVGTQYTDAVIPHTEYPAAEARYMVASFVNHLQLEKSPSLSFLETVVQGNMLANAVFLPDYTQSPFKFRNTSVYFDTSLLLFAVGYAGEARQAPCLELLDMLKKVGAGMYCFQHTLDESRGILEACMRKIANNDLKDVHGATMMYFLSERLTASDILTLLENLEKEANKLGIIVVKKPDYKEHDYVINEAELSQYLNQSSETAFRPYFRQEVYRNPAALQRDVDSISAIMRLRRSILPFYYEDCSAIFITTNKHLNRISRNLFYKDAQSDIVPPCQTDQAFTNIIWLKQPNSAPNLPRKRLIADCYAAIQPTDKMMREYFFRIQKLRSDKSISEEQYYLLRYKLDIVSPAIMDTTLGNEDAFTEGTITEILKITEQDFIREEQTRSAAVLQEKETELTKAYNASSELEEKLKKSLQTEAERKQRIRARAERFAVIMSNVLFVGLFLTVLAATFLTFPWGLPNFSEALPEYAVSLISAMLVILFLLSLANTMFGTRVLDITTWVKEQLADVVESILLKIGG